MTGVENCFNLKVRSARVVAETALGILKARWHCLLKRIDTEITNVSDQIIACPVLQNIYQENGEEHIDLDGVLAEILRNE